MTTVGVIAEFDPFHLGHAHLLDSIRQQFGSDCAIVCAISGYFTQRGEAACCSRRVRTEMALRGGADLILELPLPWAVASAERFARGGVELLTATGAVEVLAFGSETGELEPLQQAADIIDSPSFSPGLRQALGEGISFPAARQQTVERRCPGAGKALSRPNDTLGVEYLRAVRALGSPMKPYAVLRLGGHHGGEGGYPSGSQIREWLLTGRWGTALSAVPADCGSILHLALDEDEAPASLECCQRALLYRLKTMGPEDFAALPDCSEGLENRLFQGTQDCDSLEDFYRRTKSKRYTCARLRRMVLGAFLGLKAKDLPAHIPYLRVLGFTERGREVLSRMKEEAALPVVSRKAQLRELSLETQRLLALEERAARLWGLCTPAVQGGSQNWQDGVVIV